MRPVARDLRPSGPGRLNLFGDVLAALQTQAELNETLTRAAEALDEQVKSLWADNAALRDELHATTTALSNRLSSLARIRITGPGATWEEGG